MISRIKGADRLFLGLDLGTQSLKSCIIDSDLNVIYRGSVGFDADLPEFETDGGVHRYPDGRTVTAPALMWVAALDRLLEKLRDEDAPLSRVVAVSGSGQQHGSVWLKKGVRQRLRRLHSARTLQEQLEGIFTLPESPVWMDSSTTKQVRELEYCIGGREAMAELTGSRAIERFTASQIAKVFQTQRRVYKKTERIALVSSFMASLLVGDYAPIDFSDGSGMNLLDIRRKVWADKALSCTALDLHRRLGRPVASYRPIGRLRSYYRKRFGFPRGCAVIAWSGDNPNSLAGLRLKGSGDIAVSLGTSDTVFGSLSDPKPSGTEGHVFVNPVSPDEYMALICYKNGSLTREGVRDRCAEGRWDRFNDFLCKTAPGNGGNFGFFIDVPEITPPLHRVGVYRFGPDGGPREAFEPEVEVRAVIEGQFLSMRIHAERVGIVPRRLLATGGASSNGEIVRILSDVFGVPVYIGEQPDSAALGAAYRALHGFCCARMRRFISFGKAIPGDGDFRLGAEPNRQFAGVYDTLRNRYEEAENKLSMA